MTVKQTASKTNTYEYGTATIVVHRPVLDDREREKRERLVCNALAQYGQNIQRNTKKEVQ